MEWDVFVTAGHVIRVHAAAAVLAVVLGPVALFRRSRDVWHKVAGVLWVGAMLVVALSSFFIQEARHMGAFSVIHVLSVVTLWGLGQGMWALWRGQRRRHGQIMRGLYLQALVLAGVFTFLPGRRMNVMLFEAAPWVGFVVAMMLGGILGAVIWRDGRGQT